MLNSDSILLTFVIPCFKVEKYLQRCLDSVYGCGLSENLFEVLCINDCSPDNTQYILETNKREHNNLSIIVHETNKGLGAARNRGIIEARGLYLWFVDSDDTIASENVCSCLSIACEHKLDVLCFNYSRVDDMKGIIPTDPVFRECSVMNGYTFIKHCFGNGIKHHMGYVVRFFYRVDYLREKHLYFPENVYWEDTVYMPKSLLLADKVASISTVLYFYRINVDSISGTFSRAYPAKMIFDYSFCTGSDLLNFAQDVSEAELSAAFKQVAINKYINGLMILLFRTTAKERKQFYRVFKDKKDSYKALKQYMNTINNLLLLPFIGRTVSEIGSFIYQMKHSLSLGNV